MPAGLEAATVVAAASFSGDDGEYPPPLGSETHAVEPKGSRLQGGEVPATETENSMQHAGESDASTTPTTPTSSSAEVVDTPVSTSPVAAAPTSPPSAGLGLSLLQTASSSPPPHSYRHSRAYRHFKNPPQPHMCIRTTTDAGEELFINVLSWTRIVIPQEPSDPIPLYGGMRVPPGSPRSPPIVFAVMANPEVLKDSGRHSKDPEERRAMVELMCDFVEAMNPGVKLVRNAVILKDRDISGELKDVWNAVQAQRDREREEQLLQQRQQQQQHYHNLSGASNGSTAQQMFPRTVEDAPLQRKQNTAEEATVQSSVEPDSGLSLAVMTQQFDRITANTATLSMDSQKSAHHNETQPTNCNPGRSCEEQGGVQTLGSTPKTNASRESLKTGNENKDCAEAEVTHSSGLNNQTSSSGAKTNPVSPTSPTANGTAVGGTLGNPAVPPQTTASVSAPPATPPATTKKEKLGGFLPNGCIFPRFKNNKHKDKDKDKEKESKEKETKSKDKERKVLLNALKKSKEKKVSSEERQSLSDSAEVSMATKRATHTPQQYANNCINQLESEVQKLDLNKMEMTTTAAAKPTPSNNHAAGGGVGVH